MRLLVTGGTGFIGQHLVRALCQHGATAVTLLTRQQTLPASLAPLRNQLAIAQADLSDFERTARVVAEVRPTAVIHLAATGTTHPFLSPDLALRDNVQATLNLARACFANDIGVQQLVVARTPGERSLMNVYAASKAAAWGFCQMYARTQQWPIQGAMIFQAYGAGQADNALIPAAMKAAVAGQDFPMTAGQQQRDWVHVQDVVAGLMALLKRPLSPAMTVELGTGVLTSVADVVAQIYALVNRGGRPLVGVLSSRPGEVVAQQADVVATAGAIRWQARLSLVEGLQKLLVS